MVRPPLENIDPLEIFMHALGLHVAENALGTITQNPDVQLASQVVQANMILSSLTSELFFKCLVCIETKLTPQGHYLSDLFDQLKPETQQEIVELWDTHIVPVREPQWEMIESGLPKATHTFCRDLPGALVAANRSFERMRYSYEPTSKTSVFNIGDLPRILHRVILQKKPEWANLGRNVTKVGEAQPGQPPTPARGE